VIYGNQEIFGDIPDTGKTLVAFRDYYKETSSPDPITKYRKLIRDLFYRNVLPNTGVLVRKHIYDVYGGFDCAFLRLHDYDFWVRTARYITVKHCGRTMCKWRWHRSNLSAGSSQRNLKYDSMVLDRILHMYSLKDLFPFYEKKDDQSSLSRCYFEMGRQYRRISSYSRAVNCLLEAIRLDFIKMAYYELLSIVTLFSHELTEEVRMRIPGSILYHAKLMLPELKGKTAIEKYGIASLNKKLGNLDRAREIFEKMAAAMEGKKKYNSLLPGIYFHLGEIDRLEKKYEAAKTMFERCIEIQPNHKKAARYLNENLNDEIPA
jgi:tetratricopeptide (TPR) repeat protein